METHEEWIRRIDAELEGELSLAEPCSPVTCSAAPAAPRPAPATWSCGWRSPNPPATRMPVSCPDP